MPRGTKRKSSQGNSQSDDELESESQRMCFSQHAPEVSQDILPPKASEQRNFDNLPAGQREKILADLSRLALFKGLAGEPIDRKTVCKEAGITGPDQGRISSAAFAIAAERLRNVFGFELGRLPAWMEDQKSTKKKYSERHYLVTSESDNSQGEHSKALYAQHAPVAVGKGLLIVVLALIYCKGDQRADGSRWIADSDLYRLLNVLDENMPKEPPAPGGSKKGPSRCCQGGGKGLAMTPDIDTSLEQFVKQDYLLKEKITEEQLSSAPTADENSLIYAMGPRAALEIGRRQVLFFCAEILDEEPDQAMIEDIERDEEHQDKLEE